MKHQRDKPSTIELYPIKNIHPISGVTVEQLWKHCHYLLTKISNSLFLDETAKKDICVDVALNVHKKMLVGKVPKTIYEDFKHYLFVSLKNEVNQYNINNNLKRNSPLNIYHTVELNEEIKISGTPTDYEDKQYQDLRKKLFEQAFNILTPEKQGWILGYLSGKSFPKIARGEGKKGSEVRKIVREMNAILLELARKENLENMVHPIIEIPNRERSAKTLIKEENKQQALAYRRHLREEKKQEALERKKKYYSNMGRPPKETSEVEEQIFKLRAEGNTHKAISTIVGLPWPRVWYIVNQKRIKLDNAKKRISKE